MRIEFGENLTLEKEEGMVALMFVILGVLAFTLGFMSNSLVRRV